MITLTKSHLNAVDEAPDQTDILLLYKPLAFSNPRWIVAGWFDDGFYSYENDSDKIPNPIGWLDLPTVKD